jgi:hypothetical protein
MDTEDIRALRARRYKSAGVQDAAVEEGGVASAATGSSEAIGFNFKSGVTTVPVSIKDEADANEALSKYTTLQDTSDEDTDAVSASLQRAESSRVRNPYPNVSFARENIKQERGPTSGASSYPAFVPSREDLRPNRETRSPSPIPTPTREPEPAAEERLCRICFSPQTPDERLISPCKCKGSAKWIHENCLNQWRVASQNRRSFYQCDQCLYKYSFYRTDFANWLSAPPTVFFCTVLAFTFAMFVGGFIVKFGLWLFPPGSMIYYTTSWLSGWFYTPFDAGTDLLNAVQALVPVVPRKFSDIFVVDVWHFAQGFVSLGMIGVIGFMGTGGLFTMRIFNPRRRRAGNDQGRASLGIGELALILVLFAGCAKIAVSLWRIVREMIMRRLHGASQRIREVHD